MRFAKSGVLVATADDVWCVLVTGDNGRVTSVGPYKGIAGLERAKQDAAAWRARECRTLICRMMPPADFDAAGDEDALFGYSANMHKRTAPLIPKDEVQPEPTE